MAVSESGGAAPRRGERLEMASARVPFRLKVALVWLVLFVIAAAFFAVAGFDTAWMRDNLSFIAYGLRYTLAIALAGIILAIVLAGLGALGRLSSNAVAYGLSGFYVSFFRGTPLIVQMFLIYLAMPQVARGLSDREAFPSISSDFADIFILEAAVAGTLALGLNYGAYMTEIFRAGIQSVNSGQGEAADALGMTHARKMRIVVLPQALRVVIPPTGNEFIAMMKDTALVSFLGVTVASAEIFRRSQLVGKADIKNLEAFLVAAAMYWLLTAVFSFFQARLERRISSGYDRTATVRSRPHGGGHATVEGAA